MFSQILLIFGHSDGQVTHLGRPWLRPWTSTICGKLEDSSLSLLFQFYFKHQAIVLATETSVNMVPLLYQNS